MAVQLMVVHHLSKAGYGAFAYALAIVMLGETIVLFGLDRAVGVIMPISMEKRDYATAFGVMVLSLVTVISLGALLTVAVVLSRGALEGAVIDDRGAVTLLALMIVLSPIQALEDLLVGIFSVLGKPRTIFVRTYVIAPALRLAVAVVLIATQSGVYFLAAGYVLTGVAGLAISITLLVAILRREGLLEHLRPNRMRLPFRATFAFTLPLLSTDLVNVLLFSSDALLLGHFRGASEVASFRVIIPIVSLIMVPASVFALLYVPLASRLFARGERAALEDLYWRTTLWIAVACFPVFALGLSAAEPITSVMYGSRYADSALFLTILAVGYYFQSALGFSGLTLMVFGRVRFLTALNVVAMVVNVALNFILIPAYGALGAAIGTTTTLIAYNAFKQVGLRARTGVRLLVGEAVRPFVGVGLAAAGLLALHPVAKHHAGASVAIAALASVAVIAVTYRSLDLARTFPEVARLPWIRRLVAHR
jgi:O-antigen/teichoic acid export membrane protein